MQPDAGNLLWLDLEMTGLDPSREAIIEIATLVTNHDLEVIAEGPDLIIHQDDALLDAMDEWNTKHHGRSGLTNLVRRSEITTAEAERLTLEFVAAHCPEGEIPLAGNSVHQDRLFLAREMPDLTAWLHYRNVDVSTIKELASRWYPEIYRQRPKKQGDHRAAGDIMDSLDELRYYRAHIFKLES